MRNLTATFFGSYRGAAILTPNKTPAMTNPFLSSFKHQVNFFKRAYSAGRHSFGEPTHTFNVMGSQHYRLHICVSVSLDNIESATFGSDAFRNILTIDHSQCQSPGICFKDSQMTLHSQISAMPQACKWVESGNLAQDVLPLNVKWHKKPNSTSTR